MDKRVSFGKAKIASRKAAPDLGKELIRKCSMVIAEKIIASKDEINGRTP